MIKPAIFIDGDAGTTGLQIRERLKGRQDLEIVGIPAEKRKDADERCRLMNDVDLVILCLPDDAAREAVALIRNRTVRIIDASTAHRVASEWVYGFPELLAGQSERIHSATKVSNPGCWPTGALALIRPLIASRLLPSDHPLSIGGISGYTGGGRQLIEAFERPDNDRITDPYRLYGLQLTHKHLPEIVFYGGLARKPLFTPAYGAFPQGMLVQVPLALWTLPRKVSGSEIYEVLAAKYEGQPFVRVMPLEPPDGDVLSPVGLVGTNLLELFVFQNVADEHVLLVARLDNLGKGA